MKLARWILVAVALAAIVWFFARSSDRTAVAESAPVPKVEAPTKTSEPLAVPVETKHEGREVVGASEPAPAATADAVELVTLHVIERDSKKPIVRARVRVVEYSKAIEASLWDGFRRDAARAEQYAIDHGDAYATDGVGVAMIRKPRHESLVVASKDRWFGFRVFNRYADELTLELALDDDLSVRTLDSYGQPIGGIEVELREADLTPYQAVDRCLTATTRDGDGIAVLSRARSTIESASSRNFAVYAKIVCAEPARVTVDANHWPTRALDIALPPLGSVDVHVIDGDTVVPTTPVRVIARRSANEPDLALAGRMFTDMIERATDRGSAHFEHVAIDTDLQITTWSGFQQGAKRAAGPTQAGERVNIVLDVNESLAVLHGRLIDASGSPIRADSVSYKLVVVDPDGVTSTAGSIAKLDVGGEFVVRTLTSLGARTTRVLTLRDPRSAKGDDSSSAIVHIDGALAAGVKDLGDVMLVEQPTLIDGIVVDEQQVPVAGARLLLARPINDPTTDFPWQTTGAATSTHADGRFAFHVPWNESVVGLLVEARDFVRGGAQSFPPGSHDVTIRVHRGGLVEGTVLFDVNAIAIGFDVSCVPASAAENQWYREQLSRDPKLDDQHARFAFKDVEPGKARVAFRARGGALLAVIDGVSVVAGQSSDDPRLREVDLRGMTHPIRIVVRDAAGELIKHATVRARIREEPNPWVLSDAFEGSETLLVRSLPFDLEIGASQHRTKRINGVGADLDVTLEVGLPIELTLDADSRSEWSKDAVMNIKLDAGTNQTNVDGFSSELGESARPDANGVISTRAPEPGRYELAVRIDHVVHGRMEEKRFACEPSTIDVRDVAEAQHFDISISAAERAKIDAFVRE